MVDSPSGIQAVLLLESNILVLHKNNVVTLYNKDQATQYNIRTFENLDSNFKLAGFQNKKEDVIIVLYSDFSLISIIFKNKNQTAYVRAIYNT